jgi:hypothetical protein
MMERKSEMSDEILQCFVIVGLLIARVTIRESPLKITEENFRERDNLAANNAAVASP